MQHRISIFIDNKHLLEAQAETDLGPTPQLFSPDIITGKLTDQNKDVQQWTWQELASAIKTCNVEVGFEGQTYQFRTLDEITGNFELMRIRGAGE